MFKLKRILIFLFVLLLFTRGLFPLFFTEIAITGLFVIVIFFQNEKSLRISKQSAVILYWILLYSFISLITFGIVRGATEYLSYVGHILFAIVIILFTNFTINTEENIKYLVKDIININSLIAFFSILAYILQVNLGIRSSLLSIGQTVRIVGLFGNPNYYATALLVSFSLLIGFQKYYGIYTDFRYYVFFCINLIGLFLTYSRGAWIAIFVVMLMYFWKNIKHFITIKNLIVIGLALGITMIVASYLQDTVAQIIEQTFFRFETADTGAGRYYIWEHGWKLVTSNLRYLLFGVGGNQFIFYEEFGIYNQVHQMYLRTLYETGLFGFILFIFLIIYLLLIQKKMFGKLSKSPVFWGLLALMIMGLSNDIHILKEFWLIISIILVTNNFQKNKKFIIN